MVNNSFCWYQQNELQPPLNSDGQQFHQYWWNELQPPLNSDGQQFYQYQQNELQPPLNSDGQQFVLLISTKRITTTSKQRWSTITNIVLLINSELLTITNINKTNYNHL